MSQQEDPVKEIEIKIYDAVKRSATVILSAQIKKNLGQSFSTPQFILILFAAQSFLTYLRSFPGFGAPWNTLRSIAQNVAIQTSVGYVTESWDRDAAFLNLILALVAVECVPAASGWLAQDVASFRTSISYIFSEKLSDYARSLGVSALAGASIGACIPPRSWGIIGETLALTGVNALCEVAFSVVDAGFSLSLAWPIVLLYFAKELSDRHDYFQPYFDFGLFKISEIVYGSLARIQGISAEEIGLGFGFAFFVAPRDKLWGGLCALVLVYAWSDWLLRQVLGDIAKTDPVFAGLVSVTAIYVFGVVIKG